MALRAIHGTPSAMSISVGSSDFPTLSLYVPVKSGHPSEAPSAGAPPSDSACRPPEEAGLLSFWGEAAVSRYLFAAERSDRKDRVSA